MKQLFILLFTFLSLTACDRSKTRAEEKGDDREGLKVKVDNLDTTIFFREAYYPNGKLKAKGKFDEGQKHGVWQWWINNGQLKDSGRFEHGKVVKRTKNILFLVVRF